MYAIQVNENGGPEVLRFVELVDPQPREAELLVEVEAAGINFVDVYQRTGLDEVPKPFIPGLEGVGRVLEPCEPFRRGDRIAWVGVKGSYAQLLIVPASRAIRIPDSFTISQSLLFQGITAQYLIHEYRTIQPGDIALVHSAAGGCGQLLVQWLKHLGAIVIATASTSAKLETARSLGADHLVNYAESDFGDAVLQITGGRGVDIAYDAVGKTTLRRTLDTIAIRGTAVTFGAASGAPPAIEGLRLILKSIRLVGGSITSYIATPKDLQSRAQQVIDAVSEGWLKVSEGTAYALENALQAHHDLEGRKTEGKLYLLPRETHSTVAS
jgi:NADPH2:quinone reductase